MDDRRQLILEAAADQMRTFQEAFGPNHHGGVLSDDDFTGFDVKASRKMIQDKIILKLSTMSLLNFINHENNKNKIIVVTTSKEETERLRKLEKKGNIKVLAAKPAISFPDIVADILGSIHEIPGVSLADIRASVGYPEYPPLSRKPNLGYFLPKMEKTSTHILNVFLYVKLMNSESFNSSKNEWNNMDPAQKIAAKKAYQTRMIASEKMAYQLIVFDFDLYSEEERMEMCNALEIMVDGKYSDIWIVAADKAKAKLESKYGSAF